MTDHIIIDRRKNPKNKVLGNKQRFIERAKELLKRSVEDSLSKRSVTSEEGQDVSIPKKGVSEPVFGNDQRTGKGDYVLPGNKEYKKGDLIEKPKGGGSGGGPGDASDSEDELEDEYKFLLSKEEYFNILFDGLELPNFIKKSDTGITSFKSQRSGYANSGTPSNLDVLSTMKKSMGRRLALRKPKEKRIKEIEKLLETCGEDDRESLTIELEDLRRKLKTVPYVDPVDVRYRNFDLIPNPQSKAAMFCIMDVSASMTQHEKDLAKRFFILLYTFLKRKYEKVDIIFIRHHSVATECNEDDFFYSQESGGTVVSSAFELMSKIQRERYPASEYNLYCAQASDGDNFSSDNEKLATILREEILPEFSYFCYIEIEGEHAGRQHHLAFGMYVSTMWNVYSTLINQFNNMKIKRVSDASDIYPVFKELFSGGEKK